jgi:hypothetical protein
MGVLEMLHKRTPRKEPAAGMVDGAVAAEAKS